MPSKVVTMPRDLSRRELFGFWRKGEREPEKPARPPPRIWLRPPGADSEDVFADTCQRCGKCIEICPRECIFPLEADGTPAIIARRAPCVLCDGILCTTVCPSGALQRLERREEVHMGLAVVIQRTCVTWHGQPCDVCHTACPVPGALRLEWAQPIVDGDKCTGCGLCEFSCPTAPASIVVRPRQP